ncbi:MAG: hemerythrin domain-containing protein [Myxococcales bacterium]
MARLRPSEVRERVLEEHVALRKAMEELQQLVVRAEREGDEPARVELKTECDGLLRTLHRHLDFEDRLLEPTLRAIDAWGPIRADRLRDDHRAQRRELDRLAERLGDPANTAGQCAAMVRTFLEWFARDMEEEERDILHRELLRDDAIATNIFTG